MTRQTPPPVPTLEQIARRIGGRVRGAGADRRLGAHGGVHPGWTLGCRRTLQPGTMVGSVSFRSSPVDGQPQLIPHNGGAIIEDEVEIGATCCVGRATSRRTIIGAEAEIDNRVPIAHHVRIGPGRRHWPPEARAWETGGPAEDLSERTGLARPL